MGADLSATNFRRRESRSAGVPVRIASLTLSQSERASVVVVVGASVVVVVAASVVVVVAASVVVVVSDTWPEFFAVFAPQPAVATTAIPSMMARNGFFTFSSWASGRGSVLTSNHRLTHTRK